MLYGRRKIHSQSMPLQKRRKFILHRAFQYKYTWYLVTALGGCGLLFFLPSLWFIQQNYELIKNLAYDLSPHIVDHLEREVVWIKFFLSLSIVSVFAVSLVLGIRMTKTLIDPLIRLERHMRQLMLGHWGIAEYRISDDEDFRDLSLTYDYFHRTLKANTEAELKLLEKMTIDPQDRESYAAWKALIEIKQERLGIDKPAIVHDVKKSGADSLHHAS